MNESKNLWGGRFTGKANENFVKFNRSFGFDYQLLAADVRGSSAHCEGLRRAGILTDDEASEIQRGLEKVLEIDLRDTNFLKDFTVEDVHSFIEARLVEIIGDAGRKLHTGRSRNDQVATALRLWLREKIDELKNDLRDAQAALLESAEANETIILPGYTHLQRAQPILFAHWCLAYFEMLKRDAERLSDVRKRVNILPLGSAALAGTSYPIDREKIAEDLEFEAVSANSLDAVSDRDFAIEFASAASLIMMHLSRLAEDVILYATTEFGFFELSDAIATGSSLMPQKKNPDSIELVRGKSGRVFGHLVGLLTVLKSLPLAYNKDMQEDKEAIFDTFQTTHDCLQIAAIVLRNVRVRADATRQAASTGYLNATELADYLAKKNIPFRTAHDITGRVVLRAIELNVELNDLELSEMQKFSEQIDEDVYDALSLEKTLQTKSAIGGTAPRQVEKALKNARLYLAENGAS